MRLYLLCAWLSFISILDDLFKTEKKMNKINIYKRNIESVKKIVFQLQFLLHVYSPILASFWLIWESIHFFFFSRWVFLFYDHFDKKKTDEITHRISFWITLCRDYAIFSHHFMIVVYSMKNHLGPDTRGNAIEKPQCLFFPTPSPSTNEKKLQFIVWESYLFIVRAQAITDIPYFQCADIYLK